MPSAGAVPLAPSAAATSARRARTRLSWGLPHPGPAQPECSGPRAAGCAATAGRRDSASVRGPPRTAPARGAEELCPGRCEVAQVALPDPRTPLPLSPAWLGCSLSPDLHQAGGPPWSWSRSLVSAPTLRLPWTLGTAQCRPSPVTRPTCPPRSRPRRSCSSRSSPGLRPRAAPNEVLLQSPRFLTFPPGAAQLRPEAGRGPRGESVRVRHPRGPNLRAETARRTFKSWLAPDDISARRGRRCAVSAAAARASVWASQRLTGYVLPSPSPGATREGGNGSRAP